MNCTEVGKFSCASSGLCLQKDALQNRYERVDRCTSSGGRLCQNNPCGRNGICYEGMNNDFYCGCKPGWKGKICDSESELLISVIIIVHMISIRVVPLYQFSCQKHLNFELFWQPGQNKIGKKEKMPQL